jgi:hypothetical protein
VHHIIDINEAHLDALAIVDLVLQGRSIQAICVHHRSNNISDCLALSRRQLIKSVSANSAKFVRIKHCAGQNERGSAVSKRFRSLASKIATVGDPCADSATGFVPAADPIRNKHSADSTDRCKSSAGAGGYCWVVR